MSSLPRMRDLDHHRPQAGSKYLISKVEFLKKLEGPILKSRVCPHEAGVRLHVCCGRDQHRSCVSHLWYNTNTSWRALTFCEVMYSAWCVLVFSAIFDVLVGFSMFYQVYWRIYSFLVFGSSFVHVFHFFSHFSVALAVQLLPFAFSKLLRGNKNSREVKLSSGYIRPTQATSINSYVKMSQCIFLKILPKQQRKVEKTFSRTA